MISNGDPVFPKDASRICQEKNDLFLCFSAVFPSLTFHPAKDYPHFRPA